MKEQRHWLAEYPARVIKRVVIMADSRKEAERKATNGMILYESDHDTVWTGKIKVLREDKP